MGDPYEGGPGKGEFHENPAACICNSDGRSLVELAQDPKASSAKEQGKIEAKLGTEVAVKWPDFEEYDAENENVRVEAEDVVHAAFVGEEVLDAVKEDAKLEAKLEEVESEENPFLLD